MPVKRPVWLLNMTSGDVISVLMRAVIALRGNEVYRQLCLSPLACVGVGRGENALLDGDISISRACTHACVRVTLYV